jgi:hypothetical protein
VNPIRPQLPPTTPAARPTADGRAAFFQSVKAAAPTTPAAPVERAAPRISLPTPPVASAQAQAEPAQPQRYLRPGSLIDIKV